MNNMINFSDFFCKEIDSYYKRYKQNNGKIKKHVLQKRYLSLLNFINKECYWSRFNVDTVTEECINSNYIDGKYLNQIHNYLTKYNFYDKCYSGVLEEYFKATNYSTLHTLSIDSTFIRNILGHGLSRNPEYKNKPGLKVHVLVDTPKLVYPYHSLLLILILVMRL